MSPRWCGVQCTLCTASLMINEESLSAIHEINLKIFIDWMAWLICEFKERTCFFDKIIKHAFRIAKKGKSKWIFYEDHQSICSDDNDNWKLSTQLCTKQNLWTRSKESVKKLFFFSLFHADSIMCATLMCLRVYDYTIWIQWT